MAIEEGEKTVLVMDDETMVGDIVCQMLRYLGFGSVFVTNGDDAIAEYRRRQSVGETFAAVIMDLTIPGGMGGKEAISEILALDNNANVFVSSGYVNDPIMLNYGDYGFRGVIAKPFDLVTIKEIFAAIP